MARFRSAVALVLLAALAAGGTIAPLVHGALHAEETAQTEAWSHAHLADGHHHHEADDDHGREALPPCPEPLDTHLTCVLCAAAGGAVALAETSASLTTDLARLGTQADVLAETDRTAHGARGPPAIA